MPKSNPLEVADRLHSAAIRLLRRLRVADDETGLSAPKLSALSVLVFAGPQSLKELARAEQVTPPTMSKLVADLETEGLAIKHADHKDKRGVRIEVTAKGRALMEEGRRRRLALWRKKLARLPKADLALLDDATRLMLRIAAED
ncbi:MAG: MarR family transcriptional regulator [Proteobacteria bacterium]|nr:MarR family transcriptional regulator [Pseudomonadota bacterium]